MTELEQSEKRRPGRPRKVVEPKVEAKTQPKTQHKMRAKPNWETFDATSEDSPDKLRIDKSLIPEGMDMQWVTSEVFGQPDPQHRADFERKGWTPVHQDDFNGQFDGMFMPKGKEGEITVHGLVLMARPLEFSMKAKKEDRRKAMEQVLIKEAALRGGDIPVTLDARHQTALVSNRINKSIERIEIPDK